MVTRTKNSKITTVLIILILFIQISCTTKAPSDLSKESIIPKPVSITATGDYFKLKAGTDIYVQGESAELKQIGQYLADRLKPSTGFGIDVKPTTEDETVGQ
jgi:hexosaminidase